QCPALDRDRRGRDVQGFSARRLSAGHALKPTRLLLPVADAAGVARPGLDARIHGLRVERVAVRQPGSRRAAWLIGAEMRDPRMRYAYSFDSDFPRLRARRDG